MGKVINIYGYRWEVLDEEYETAFGRGILCLMKEPIKVMAFSKYNDNYYENSDIYKFLSELRCKLEKLGAEFETEILDPTAEDGTKYNDMSIFVRGPFLLTLDIYRKYRINISDRNDLWWLATAYSFNSDCSEVLNVFTDGTIDNSTASYEKINVFPACIFSSIPQSEKQKEIEDLKEQIKDLQERIEILESEEEDE